VGEQLDAVRASLRELAQLAKAAGADAVGAAVAERVAQAGDRPTRDAYTAAVPPEHIFMGLERYWRKRAERETAGQSA
jgi:hypothetical protein